MSHPWRWLAADKHLGGSRGRPHAASPRSLVRGRRTVILSDWSRERRGASVDHRSHNRGGETQLGHEHVRTARFEQRRLFRGGHSDFWNEEADSRLQDSALPPRNVFSAAWKSLYAAFWPLQVLPRFGLKVKLRKSRAERRQSCWPTL